MKTYQNWTQNRFTRNVWRRLGVVLFFFFCWSNCMWVFSGYSSFLPQSENHPYMADQLKTVCRRKCEGTWLFVSSVTVVLWWTGNLPWVYSVCCLMTGRVGCSHTPEQDVENEWLWGLKLIAVVCSGCKLGWWFAKTWLINCKKRIWVCRWLSFWHQMVVGSWTALDFQGLLKKQSTILHRYICVSLLISIQNCMILYKGYHSLFVDKAPALRMLSADVSLSISFVIKPFIPVSTGFCALNLQRLSFF